MTSGFYRVRVREAAPPALRTVAVVAWFLLVGAVCGPAASVSAEPERFAETRRLMGVPWTITVYALDREAGATAIAAGFAEVGRLERILSDYDPESELSRLSALAPTQAAEPVGDDLWRVLVHAVDIRDMTAGAFDPTVGPLTDLWRQARRTGRMPTEARVSAARRAVGPDTLRLVRHARAVALDRPGMRLDLGGIGMGYAVDRALEVLGRHGIEAAMIDASGDIGVSGPPPGSRGWSIAVAPLQAAGAGHAEATTTQRLSLAHQAVTTSGDAFQAVEIDGRRYSHIVDPRTGIGVVGPSAVTVVARDCATADALATACSVLGPTQSRAVIARQPGCAARFVWLENGRVRYESTTSWSSQTTQTADR